MAERLNYPTGDLVYGQNMQTTRSVTVPIKRAGVNYSTHEAITVTTSLAIRLTGNKIVGHNYAFITVETDKVRFLMDADPTASSGHELQAGDSLVLESFDELDSIRFFGSGSGSATLQVSYGLVETNED